MMENEQEWIEWSGGECPLAADALVQVKFRDGSFSVEQRGMTAGYLDRHNYWIGNGEARDDIVAYRVVPHAH